MSTYHSTQSAASSTSGQTQAAGGSRPSTGDRHADSRGSVLVFVVGILLLLAIIATAFLGTSRTDRTATQQNAFNTQIDLLMEGVKEAVKAKIAADGRWNADANSFDSPLSDTFLASRIPQLLRLGDATVGYIQTTPGAAPPKAGGVAGYNFTLTSSAPTSNLAAWPHISSPLFGSFFSYPMQQQSGMRSNFDARDHVVPTSITINGKTYPALGISTSVDGIASGGTPTFPAADFAESGPFLAVIPAMDTDGDGIADAGMVQLPIGQIAGVTYYCGVRVVDMNSALNANIATHWNDTPQANFSAATPYGSTYTTQAIIGNFFPTNIDLYNALTGSGDPDRVAQLTPATTGLYTLRWGEGGDGIAASSTVIDVVDDNIANRGDYRFTNVTEQMWMQLGRRLNNPGYHFATGTTFKQMAQLDINNAVALASKFILNENGTSNIEKSLVRSLKTNSPTKAYTPDQALNWFNSNFAFPRVLSGGNQPMPIRSILTTLNPTGADQPPIPEEIKPAPTTYVFGNIGTFLGRKFVCIAPFTTVLPTDLTAGVGMRDWALLGSANGTEKTNLNTADFGELYWSFRRYLSTPTANLQQPAPAFAASSPFPMVGVTATGLSLYEQNKWRQYRNVIRDPMAQDPMLADDWRTKLPNAVATATTPELAPRFMTSSEVMQMRAALAAVNTIDLRDDDDNITARRIQTAVYPNSPIGTVYPRHDVTVFGTERQPYLTEVYVNNDTSVRGGGANPRGYVAIEFYNPYPDPINLNGWSLGVINRRRGANGAPTLIPAKSPGQPLTIEPLLSQPGTGFNFGRFGSASAADPWNDIIIPGNGYLVLENYNEVGNTVNDPTAPDPAIDATYRPAGMGAFTATNPAVRVKFVRGLSRLLWDGLAATPGVPNGGELVLLRPRIANLHTGVFTPTTPVNNTNPESDPCDEGAANANPNLYDLVPVDSFDFTNMDAVAASTNFNVWHYVRSNGAGSTADAWEFVKGGKYVVTGSPGTTPQSPAYPRQGFVTATFTAADVEPLLAPTSNFGLADATEVPAEALATNPKKQGVQINAEGWPGPRQKDATNTFNLFPAGAFSRETDVFKIPTIGSYKILTRAVAAPTITPDGMRLPATVEDVANLAEVGNFTEMNTVAMDHTFADNEDPADLAAATTGVAPTYTAGTAPPPQPLTAGFDDSFEQVGRLCPSNTLNPAAYVNYPNTWAAPGAYVMPDDTTGEAPAGNTTRSPIDFYDPNFDFTTGLVSTKPSRSIFDYFTVMGHSNVLPNVGLDEYVQTYQGTNLPNTPPQYPQYLPTSSSPKAAGRAPNITYMVADTGTSATTLHRGQNVPPQATGGNKIDYSNCLVQVVSGPRRGLIGQITATGGGADAMALTAPGIAGLTAGDIVRVVSTMDEIPTDSGLININTAPWYVLARLPLVQFPGSPAVDAISTSDLAKRIVQYRDGNPLGNTPYERRGHGPFKSILDLNRVMDAVGTRPIFQEAVDATNTATITPTAMSNDVNGGDISPAFTFTYANGKRSDAGTPVPAAGTAGPFSVAGDFENRYLALSRIANMVTTRSDAFVVYVQLQGWRGAGTAAAEMVTQRKEAFIVDRSTASGTASPTITRVPNK